MLFLNVIYCCRTIFGIFQEIWASDAVHLEPVIKFSHTIIRQFPSEGISEGLQSSLPLKVRSASLDEVVQGFIQLGLETSKDGGCTASLSNPFHHLAVLMVESSPFLSCFNLCPLISVFLVLEVSKLHAVFYVWSSGYWALFFLEFFAIFSPIVKGTLSSEGTDFSPFLILSYLQFFFPGDKSCF